MKILVNRDFGGGFGFSDFGRSLIGGTEIYDDDIEARVDPKIIALVENHGKKMFVPYSKVEIAEIPDNATDYDIQEDDGYEQIIYVVNGKIYYN